MVPRLETIYIVYNVNCELVTANLVNRSDLFAMAEFHTDDWRIDGTERRKNGTATKQDESQCAASPRISNKTKTPCGFAAHNYLSGSKAIAEFIWEFRRPNASLYCPGCVLIQAFFAVSISFYTIFSPLFAFIIWFAWRTLVSYLHFCTPNSDSVTLTMTVTTNGGCGDDAWISYRIKYVPGKLLACFTAPSTFTLKRREAAYIALALSKLNGITFDDAKAAHNPNPWQCAGARDLRFVHSSFYSYTEDNTPSNEISSNAFYRLCFMFIFRLCSFFCYGVRIYLFESHLPALNSYFKCE